MFSENSHAHARAVDSIAPRMPSLHLWKGRLDNSPLLICPTSADCVETQTPDGDYAFFFHPPIIGYPVIGFSVHDFAPGNVEGARVSHRNFTYLSAFSVGLDPNMERKAGKAGQMFSRELTH